MAINVENEFSGDENVDIASLFKVLISEIQGLTEVQQETKDVLARAFEMKGTFSVNPAVQDQATEASTRIREAQVDTSQAPAPAAATAYQDDRVKAQDLSLIHI